MKKGIYGRQKVKPVPGPYGIRVKPVPGPYGITAAQHKKIVGPRPMRDMTKSL